MCLVVTCCERADFLALVCGVLLCVCYFPIGILGQVWYLIVSIPDLCTLTYFYVFTLFSIAINQLSLYFKNICVRLHIMNNYINKLLCCYIEQRLNFLDLLVKYQIH